MMSSNIDPQTSVRHPSISKGISEQSVNIERADDLLAAARRGLQELKKQDLKRKHPDNEEDEPRPKRVRTVVEKPQRLKLIVHPPPAGDEAPPLENSSHQHVTNTDATQARDSGSGTGAEERGSTDKNTSGGSVGNAGPEEPPLQDHPSPRHSEQDGRGDNSSSPLSESYILATVPGRNFTRYRSLRRLAAGGNGTAYLVQSIESSKRLRVCKVTNFGLKSLRKVNTRPTLFSRNRQFAYLKEEHRRLIREVEIAKDLPRSDRICRFFDYTLGSEECNLYMEYCDGGDLGKLIDFHCQKQLSVPESFIWHAFQQIAEGLAFLHSGGYRTGNPKPVIHCDIKPDNIFLRRGQRIDDYPDVVIGDLGAAKHQPGHEIPLGTAPYQPPQLPAWEKAADIWALGATIHACCHNHTTPICGVPDDFLDQVDAHNENWRPGELLEFFRDRMHDAWSCQSKARMIWPLNSDLYSRHLEEVMGFCLNYYPAERPTAMDLLMDIEEGKQNAEVEWIPLPNGWGPYPIWQTDGIDAIIDGGSTGTDSS